MSKFRVGDYVRSKRSPEHIQKVDDQREADVFNARGADWDRVTVRLAKPRKTLTLSQGLMWLAQWSIDRSDGATMHYRPGVGWHISLGGSCPMLSAEPTLIKAIIAARKALGVKS